MNLFTSILEVSISSFKEEITHESTEMLSKTLGYCLRRDENSLIKQAEQLLKQYSATAIKAVKNFDIGNPRKDIESFDQISFEDIDEDYPPEEERKDVLIGIFNKRDDAELMWRTLNKFAVTKKDNETLANIRTVLDKYDVGLFIRPDIVAGLRELGKSIKATFYDPDIYWWLADADRDCFLPGSRADEFVYLYLSGNLDVYGKDFETFFEKHIKECPICSKVINGMKKQLKHDGAI